MGGQHWVNEEAEMGALKQLFSGQGCRGKLCPTTSPYVQIVISPHKLDFPFKAKENGWKRVFFALIWHTVPCLLSWFIEGKKQIWEMRKVEWFLKASQEK